jgi:hypothetical protein
MIMVQEKVSADSGLSDTISARAIAFGVTANKRNCLKWLGHSLRLFEVLAVLITCLFMFDQTKSLAEQTKENTLSNKLQVAQVLRDHYQTINKVLAEQPIARRAFRLSINQVMAYMLLADYDHIYQMYQEKMIDQTKWNVLDRFIRSQMNDSNLPIKKIWSSKKKRGARSPGFEKYVEACVYSDLYDSPAMNAGIDDIKKNGKLRSSLNEQERISIQKNVCPE